MNWTILYYAFIALAILAGIVVTAINWAGWRRLERTKPKDWRK